MNGTASFSLTRTTGLPSYLDLRDPEAREGTKYARAIDREWFVALNRRLWRYELWVPALAAGGWVCHCALTDDRGMVLAPPLPWAQIANAWSKGRQLRDTAAERVMAHNRKLIEAKERDQDAREIAKTEYVARAIGAELNGASRWPVRDVMEGMRNADEGRGKLAPQGKAHFGPGMKGLEKQPAGS